jgi:hypothetical protein
MTLAVLLTTFLVSLLCIYVGAYARVTADGFVLSELRRELRRERQEGDILRAEVTALRLPSAVEKRALALGMIPAAPREAPGLHDTEPAPPSSAPAVTAD